MQLKKTLAFLFLGSLFNVTGTVWNLFVAWAVASAAAKANPRIRESSIATWMTRSIGALFLVIGVRLAFSEVKSS
jgi:threonine/homoserine/homoserine lactone efflux protein